MTLFGQFSESFSQLGKGHEPVYPPSARRQIMEENESGSNYGNGGANYLQLQVLSKEFLAMKQENEAIKNAIVVLQTDRDKLRSAVRKLKVENSRFKAKLKRMTDAMKSKHTHSGSDVVMDPNEEDDFETMEDEFDYDNIGEFLLIGGPKDPLSIQYRSPIRDAKGTEHKSVERYLWYKMAETFNDPDAMNKILNAENAAAGEEILQNIKDFDQKTWDAVKLRYWEEGQRMKFEQYRNLKCLLLKTAKHYLAVASQDKVFGTGWRKQRDESARPRMWDGENRGGKFLMKLREEFVSSHIWQSSNEEQDAQNSFYENRRNIWRKMRRDGDVAMGGRKMNRGAQRGRMHSAPAPTIDPTTMMQSWGYSGGFESTGQSAMYGNFPKRAGSRGRASAMNRRWRY